jgi:hypothetical protein
VPVRSSGHAVVAVASAVLIGPAAVGCSGRGAVVGAPVTVLLTEHASVPAGRAGALVRPPPDVDGTWIVVARGRP